MQEINVQLTEEGIYNGGGSTEDGGLSLPMEMGLWKVQWTEKEKSILKYS